MRVPERNRDTGKVCAGEEVMVVVCTSLLSLSPLEATRNIGRPVGRSVGCLTREELGRPRLVP